MPSRPTDSGPVKVDNWLPKGSTGPAKKSKLNPATHLRLGQWGGKRDAASRVSRSSTRSKRLDFENTRLPHRVTEVSTLTVSPIPETDRHSVEEKEGLRPLALRPLSLGVYLVEWPCHSTFFFLFWLFFIIIIIWTDSFLVLYLQRPYSEPLTDMWISFSSGSFEVVLFAFCFKFIRRTLFQKGIPRDRRNV